MSDYEKCVLFAIKRYGNINLLKILSPNKLIRLVNADTFVSATSTKKDREKILERKWLEKVKKEPLDMNILEKMLPTFAPSKGTPKK